MKGLFLCKFDEMKGFIPIEPLFIDDAKYADDDELLKEIARNAIGFGSQLEFNSFSLRGINCISQRFSISVKEARGGSETYSLVIMSDNDVMQFKNALNKTVEQLKNWENVEEDLKILYDAIKYPERALLFGEEEEVQSINTATRRVFSDPSFHMKKESIFAYTNSVGRNFTMGVGCTLVLVLILMFTVYIQPPAFPNLFQEPFNIVKYLYTSILMFFIGLLIYFVINKKKFLRGIEYALITILFAIPIYTLFTQDWILDTHHAWIFFTNFLSALFLCIGLDNEGKIDKVSFYILIVFLLIIVGYILIFNYTI